MLFFWLPFTFRNNVLAKSSSTGSKKVEELNNSSEEAIDFFLVTASPSSPPPCQQCSDLTDVSNWSQHLVPVVCGAWAAMGTLCSPPAHHVQMGECVPIWPICMGVWPVFVCLNFDLWEPRSRRRQWHPTPVLLPGESHGWGSLVGCSPWDR